ncbi:beta-ketoacyl synthase N-terminal-like domain-containing protein [Chitinophaga sp. 30R24]|uniref:beta-ketoacyl synthase N-terminal-like domain-containing protein n=1 Tax=Chitinophaga sp. 30R24 TaxID=3248838 RepID=UPI003B911344
MNSESAYITRSCIIRHNQVYLNGALLWETAPKLALQEFLRAGYDHFSGQYPKFHKMDALSKLGWLAAEMLLKNTDIASLPPEQVGIVLSNCSGSLDTDLRYFATIKDFASPALFVYTLPNIVMGEISIRHGFKGENIFLVSDKFDTDLMSAYPAQLLATTPLQACICGWVEVMEQDYEVILFLLENKAGQDAWPLTAEAMEQAVAASHK